MEVRNELHALPSNSINSLARRAFARTKKRVIRRTVGYFLNAGCIIKLDDAAEFVPLDDPRKEFPVLRGRGGDRILLKGEQAATGRRSKRLLVRRIGGFIAA
jgi:hypothetical protein